MGGLVFDDEAKVPSRPDGVGGQRIGAPNSGPDSAAHDSLVDRRDSRDGGDPHDLETPKAAPRGGPQIPAVPGAISPENLILPGIPF